MTDVADPDAAASSMTSGANPPRAGRRLKVVGLVAAVGFVAVLLALVLQSRFDGEPEDSVDVGFMRDMISHHEQAIQLGAARCRATLEDPAVTHFAQESIVGPAVGDRRT